MGEKRGKEREKERDDALIEVICKFTKSLRGTKYMFSIYLYVLLF